MPDKLPPIKPQKRATVKEEEPVHSQEKPPATKSDTVVARRRDRKGLPAQQPHPRCSATGAASRRSPSRATSPAQAGEEKRLSRAAKARSNAVEAERAMFTQRENGFRYNAFQAPGVFSTFTADTLVLADRDRKFVEVAVSRRRAQIEHDRKQREIARADELRRRKTEQERIQKQHDLRKAQEESELRRQQEEAAKVRKSKAASHTMAERRRKEIEDARVLSERREAHRATRRDGKDPHLEAEQERQRGNSPSSSPRGKDDPSSPAHRGAVAMMVTSYGQPGDEASGSNASSPQSNAGCAHTALSIVLDALGM